VQHAVVRRRMLSYFLGDFLRYGWFFLIHRNGDTQGFARWARSTLAGASGRLRPYEPEAQHRAPMPLSQSNSETAKTPSP
jgi:hypothetical protein